MRILFYVADQNPHRDRTLGITTYTRRLLRALEARPEVELAALASASSYRPEPPVHLHRVPLRTDRALGRLLVDHGAALVRTGADLWHFPKGHLPAFRPRKPCVGTVHDTILMHYAEHYPETRSALAFAYWTRVLLASIRRLDLVCTGSYHARGQIEGVCARHGFPAPPIEVIPYGADWEEWAGREDMGVPKADYVLHLGSPEPHKRSETLLQHWRLLQERGVALPPLRIVGRLTPSARALADRLAGVQVEDRLPPGTFREAMAAARALLFPSEIEGFGLPALEAFYLGTPAVYVRGTAVEEVVGAFAGGAFDLENPSSLRDALDAALALPSGDVAALALELRQRFAWTRCAEQMVEVYRRVLTRA
jgi:glycosyltransferase involved in cell wall biosynthesis